MKKMLTVFSLVFVLAFLPVFAKADDIEVNGYSVLCNGGLGFGHAGLMYNPQGFKNEQGDYNDDAVIEVHQLRQSIKYSTYSEFNGTNEFIGYYRPKTQLTTDQRESVCKTAELLKERCDDNAINYTARRQLSYSSTTSNDGTKIRIGQITNMRCDGFVEYCYEYNNIRIFGADDTWNIAKNYTANQSQHSVSLLSLSPKIQAYDNMVSMVGDANADGEVTAADAQKTLRISGGLDIATVYQDYVCDVNNDRHISAADARIILRYSSGLEQGIFEKISYTQNHHPNNQLVYDAIWIDGMLSGAFNYFI